MNRMIGSYLRYLPMGITWCSGFGLAFAQSITLSNNSDQKTHVQMCIGGIVVGGIAGIIYPVSIPFMIWFAVLAPSTAERH